MAKEDRALRVEFDLTWKKRVEQLKLDGLIPDKFFTPSQLAMFISQIDPMLLYMDHSYIHVLLGKKDHVSDRTGKVTKRDVLPLETAKRLMDNAEYMELRDKLMKFNYNDDVKEIGRLSILMLKQKIIMGSDEMIKVGLEMDGRYMRGLKVVRKDDTERAKKHAEMVKKAFSHDDVLKLHEDN